MNDEQRKKSRLALLKAIKIAGGQVKLAKRCDVTQQAVSSWLNVIDLPIKYVILIEEITMNEVKKKDLRPDLFI